MTCIPPAVSALENPSSLLEVDEIEYTPRDKDIHRSVAALGITQLASNQRPGLLN
jgi:hypothetical protein